MHKSTRSIITGNTRNIREKEIVNSQSKQKMQKLKRPGENILKDCTIQIIVLQNKDEEIYLEEEGGEDSGKEEKRPFLL